MTNYSQINAVSGGQIKTADDLWLVRGGVLVPAIEAWAVKSGALVKVWERYGGATTMTWQTPTEGQEFPIGVSGASVTWTVKVEQGVHLVKPKGTVTFSYSDGGSDVVALDGNGVATVTKGYGTPGTRTCTATLSSTNGFTASPVQRTARPIGGQTSLQFTAPAYDQQFFGAQNITWTVRALPQDGVIPQGTIRFSPGHVTAKDVALDANGYASATFWHDSGQRTCSAALASSPNGFKANAVSHRIRMMINTRYQQTEYYTNAGHRNYAGPNKGPTTGTVAVCGDLSGDSHRAFTLVNRPAKPQPDANCVAASAVYTPASGSAGVRIGYHTINGFPATGSFSQGGVNQNLVTGPGTQSVEHWVDIGLHVAAAINNDTLRGLVFGGPSGSTPYTWISGTAYMGLVVVWEWWRWIDT